MELHNILQIFPGSKGPNCGGRTNRRGLAPGILVAAALVLVTAVNSAAFAQEPTGTRIQGREKKQEAAPEVLAPTILLDHREEMRKYIQKISAFARKRKPGFLVIPRNNPELITKIEDVDKIRVSPARTYIRSIDGILVEGVFFGEKVFGQPTPPEKRDRTTKLLDRAKQAGLNVFVIDYVKDRKLVDESYRLNLARKYVSFAAHARGVELNRLPPYPSRPFNESPKSILSAQDARNFLILEESTAYGRQDEFALKMHGTNYDLIMVDVFHGRNPLSKRAIATLKFKKVGAKRLVIALMDIGTAASYHYYWKPRWREGSPTWISAPVPGDPDRYYVQYWRPEWQKVIFGDTKSFIYGIIDQGYDGVILGGLDAYRFFIGGGEDEDQQQVAQ